MGIKSKGVVRWLVFDFPFTFAARIVWEIVDAGGGPRGPRKRETTL